MKYIVNASKNKNDCKITLEQSLKRNATFRPASTGLDHALVVASGYNQILPPVSGSSHRQLPMRGQDL